MVAKSKKVDPAGRPIRDFPVPAKPESHGPARVIAVCNQKGGVGKTTSAISLAGALAELGRHVLLVDFDPQGALTAGMHATTQDGNTIYDALIGRQKDIRKLIQSTKVDGIHLVPANIDLSAAEVHLVNEVAREQTLARLLKPVIEDYDLVIVDCQPSLGLLTINALTASDGVLIPLETEFFALRGLALLIDTIEKVRERLNPGIHVDGIVATMFDSRTLHAKEVLERVIETFGDVVLDTVVGRTVKFPDSSVAGKPITEFSPEHDSANSYRQLARELIARGSIA